MKLQPCTRLRVEEHGPFGSSISFCLSKYVLSVVCYQRSFAWTTITIRSCLQGYTEYHLKLVGIVSIRMRRAEGCQAVPCCPEGCVRLSQPSEVGMCGRIGEGRGHSEVRRGWEQPQPVAPRLSAWRRNTSLTFKPLIRNASLCKAACGGVRVSGSRGRPEVSGARRAVEPAGAARGRPGGSRCLPDTGTPGHSRELR